jgi:hypothetical protein
MVVVKGLNPKVVARAEERLLTPIPDGKGKIPSNFSAHPCAHFS